MVVGAQGGISRAGQADHLVLAAEKALKDTKEQIKIFQRQARLAMHLDEQHEMINVSPI